MANPFKQRKALVLRMPGGFPAKNLEQRLVVLECSAQLKKARGKALAFGIRCCGLLACDIKFFCPEITRCSSWCSQKIGREAHARSVTLWWGALEANEAFHSKHPTRSSAGTEGEEVNTYSTHEYPGCSKHNEFSLRALAQIPQNEHIRVSQRDLQLSFQGVGVAAARLAAEHGDLHRTSFTQLNQALSYLLVIHFHISYTLGFKIK